MSARPIKLVRFGGDTPCNAARRMMIELGYAVATATGEGWLTSTSEACGTTVVLFLACKDMPKDRLLARLRSDTTVGTLALFDCARSRLDSDILACCSEFCAWPCQSQELAARLERILPHGQALGSAGTDAVVEEFANLNLVGRSPAFVQALRLIRRIARCDAPVLILGETGTGKELSARAIHHLGVRRRQSFIPVNCGAIPDDLLENELFGHEPGAFTDAKGSQPGLVSQADGGTLFLDEIDSLSPKAQKALLRFLQHQEYQPLGGRRARRADVRIISASNANLRRLVERREFRQDLLFRLDVLSLTLPSLRDRRGDASLLAEHLFRQYSLKYRGPSRTLHPQALRWMDDYAWPGNVRELENIIHRICLLSDAPTIGLAHVVQCLDGHGCCPPGMIAEPLPVDFNAAKARTIAEFERHYLAWLMSETGGNVTLAARRAGKERRTLGRLLKKHGMQREQYLAAEVTPEISAGRLRAQ